MNTYSTVFDEKLKIWSGIKKPALYLNNVSLGQIILTSLYRSPYAIAQICHDDGSTLTNAEILRDSIRASLNLQDLGLKQGDVIEVIAQNHKNLVALLIGALLNGNTLCPLDPTHDSKYIYHTYSISKPKVVICDEGLITNIREAYEQLKSTPAFFVFGHGGNGFKSIDHLLRPHPKEELYTPPLIDDASKLPALILYSSGTTGALKCTPLSHAFMAYYTLQSIDCKCGMRTLSFISLYWISAWIIMLGTLYWNGTRIFTNQEENPKLLIEMIRTHQINLIYCPPALMTLLIKEENLNPSDYASVKSFICGGNPRVLELGIKLKRYFRNGSVYGVYGTTEMGGLISMTNFGDKISSGKLAPGFKMKIIDDNENHLGIGEMGEVCVRGTIPFLGYIEDKEETRKTFKDGWFHTGDVGYVDDDNDLHVLDRKKDVLKITVDNRNYHINPSEIESVILQIEDVVMAAVVGIMDSSHNEVATAFVVKSKGSSISEMQIIDHVKANLSENKWLLGGIYFFDKLPLTPSGKIMKQKIKENFLK